MRRRRLPIAAAALAAALAAAPSGCYQAATLPRGDLMALDDVEGRRAELLVMAEERLAAGEPGEAFHLLELQKSRRFLGQRLLLAEDAGAADTPKPAAAEAAGSDEPLDLARVLAAAPGGDGTRGLTLGIRKGQAGRLRAAERRQDELFWRDQAEVERALQVMEERGLPMHFFVKGRNLIATADEIRRALKPGQAMLSYLVGREAVHAFLLTRGALRVETLPGRPAELRALVERLVARVKDPRAGDWTADATELYRRLIGPFEAPLDGIRSLTIVPHGFLANAPFAVLHGGRDPRLLLERFALTYLPSGTLYRTILSRPLLADPPRMLALGNARYPAPWPDLPMAEAEARSVSRIFDESRLLTGAAATEARFYDLYPGFNVFHLATHGLLAGGEAAGASSLLLTRTAAADGYLSAAEIARLDLSRAYLAVLSACETSVSAGGGDGLGSITGAFLAAGIQTVLGSQWQVADESTALLMLDFYQHFLERGAAGALRQAQLRLRQREEFRHPFYWAPFVAYGIDQ